ncbi:hypothetical protein Kfla_6613 [Kribbella flavida DSM 17836]|uniref:Uncharacterized protein n=1 Tax=Kribbella flavida (strain DSM 17836 / JCM 10339 / NBRC 14399) TaxID=479435 RepID=D2PZN9_KRIFD|nr:hypothetical protein Kfla_6613 [Kribbella flavida DSM 17836]
MLGCVLVVLGAMWQLVTWERGCDPAPVDSTRPADAAIVVAPASASPGGLVAVRLTTGAKRTGFLTLGRDGKVLYYLTAGTSTAEPRWYAATDVEPRHLARPTLHGIGPHQLIVPNTALDGTYRLCADRICTSLTVSR